MLRTEANELGSADAGSERALGWMMGVPTGGGSGYLRGRPRGLGVGEMTYRTKSEMYI